MQDVKSKPFLATHSHPGGSAAVPSREEHVVGYCIWSVKTARSIFLLAFEPSSVINEGKMGSISQFVGDSHIWRYVVSG